MKKLMTLAALAACLPAFATAEVTSSNTVGYQKIQVPVSKMNIVGIPFKTVGGEGTISIQEISVDGYAGYGSDWIKIYNPQTYSYRKVIYWGEDMGGVTNTDGDNLGPGWGDENQVAVDLTLTAGQAVWTESEDGGFLVISGEIPSSSSVAVPASKMTLVANPFPVAVSLQDIDVDGYAGYGSDWIKIYNPQTYSYQKVIYWGEDMGGVTNTDGDELGPGWGNENQVAVDLTIAPGQGFWTESEDGGYLVFPNPLVSNTGD